MTLPKGVLVVLTAALLGACASGPRPTEQWTASKASVRAAEAAGAEDFPQAAMYLKRARVQINTAENLVNDEKYERARRVLERADADAQLALTLAQASEAQNEARASIDRVQRLRAKAGMQ